MTPDELKRLEEQTVEAIVSYRRDQSLEIEIWCDDHWESFAPDPPSWNPGEYYRIKPKRPREWDAYVSQNGFLYDKREISKSHQYLVDQGTLKPIRVREVIDTPKEPKERREYVGWVHDGGGDMVEVSDWEIVMGGLDPVKVGYRLATLVEKGGGE